MGNVSSNQLNVFSENVPDVSGINNQENQSENNQNSNTNHSAINSENSKENTRCENAEEGENSQENLSLCSVEPVLKQRRDEINRLSDGNKKKLKEFQEELNKKHEKRREIIAAKKKEMEDLRNEVKFLREENENLKRIYLNKINFNDSDSTVLDEQNTRIQNLIKENNELNKELTKIKEENLLTNSETKSSELYFQIKALTQENESLKDNLTIKTKHLENMTTLQDKNKELRISIAEMQSELQNLNKVVVEFEQERAEYKTHVVALKDVIGVSKKMLLIREGQLSELRQKVESIEVSLSGKEMNQLSQDIRLEYERQLQSIRNLRTLYEERQRSDQREKEEQRSLLDETKRELENEKKKNQDLEERIQELEEQNSKKYDEIKSLESNLGLSKAECRQYQAELTVINQLFSEILLGFNANQEIDLDKLTKHLEDHHGLLKEIVINEISPAASSALPKMLLELLGQLHVDKRNQNDVNEDSNRNEENLEKDGSEITTQESDLQTTTSDINSAEEIVELLPKVWRVLIELLSHQKTTTNILTEEKQPNDENPCYKTVQTPKGPSLVLSVSQTFIRLKDLILEKKALEKETGHLKQLNGHLESRLQDQEKRLGMVSSELKKTWHVVDKLQKQHQLLHTQEKILRYELAQKRKLLSTLKEELEYSRDKWQQAREKNSTTEKQWRQLRGEFAARRNVIMTEDFSNSVESGYSDEKCSSSDDDNEKGYESDVSEGAPKPEDDTDVSEQTPDHSEELELSEEIVDQSHFNNPELKENFDVCDFQTKSKTDLSQNSLTEKETSTQNQKTKQIKLDISAKDCGKEDILKDENIEKNQTYSNSEKKDMDTEDINKNSLLTSTLLNRSQNIFATNENICETGKLQIKSDETPKKSMSELIYKELEELLESEQSLAQMSNNEHFNEEKPCVENKKTEIDENQPSTSKLKKHSVVEEIWALKNEILRSEDEQLPEKSHKNSKEYKMNSEIKNEQSDKSNEEQNRKGNVETKNQAFKNKNEETSNTNSEKSKRTLEEILAAKEARLKRLEGQCQQLVDKAIKTTNKRQVISIKLDNLHETYSEKNGNSVNIEEKEEKVNESTTEIKNLDTKERNKNFFPTITLLNDSKNICETTKNSREITNLNCETIKTDSDIKNIPGETPLNSMSELILKELVKTEQSLAQMPKNEHSNKEASCMEKKTEININQPSTSKETQHSISEEILTVKNDILQMKEEQLLQNNDEIPLKALNDQPGTSKSEDKVDIKNKGCEISGINFEKPKRTFEEILAAKEARLQRLEGQCQQLVDKVTNTTNKRQVISNKLDGLHETYGEKSGTSANDEEEEDKQKESTKDQ